MSLRQTAQRLEDVTATVAMTPNQRYVLVEGESELKVLRPHVGGRAIIRELKGRPKVEEARRILDGRGAQNFVALVDADLDQVLGLNREASRLVYVSLSGANGDSTIDLESTLLRSRALQAVCEQFVGKRLLDFGGPVRFTDSIREQLRVVTSEVGAYRAAVKSIFTEGRSIQPIGELSADDWAAVVHPHSGELNRPGLERQMHEKVRNVEKFPEVKQRARDLWQGHGHGWLLCRGHDMTALLATRLSHILGGFIKRSEVEESLYDSYHGSLFKETAFGPKLNDFCDGRMAAHA
jgi:hypothetical protein